MPANYNNSAWFYDTLSRLVYGNAIQNAQAWLLQQIPQNTKILIVGGGTGWILEELTRLHPSGLSITYVEIAPAMMARSKRRKTGNNTIVFINDAVENTSLLPGFDIVLTPFLLDNFTQPGLENIFGHLDNLLKKNGLWLNASFQLAGKWWQPAMLKAMFIFFRLICNIEASALPGIPARFIQSNYKLLNTQAFYNGFISSAIYQKQ